MSKKLTSAIILAGGIGSRMEMNKTKQFIDICGKTVIERTVSAFDKCCDIDEIILVLRPEEADAVREMIERLSISKFVKTVHGGDSRAESARNGFQAIREDCDFVAIHDAARCLITSEMISKVVENAHKYGAATAACRVSDTVKTVDCTGKVLSTIPREMVYRAQTPQIFSVDVYRQALNACTDLSVITDDNMLVEKIGIDIYAVDLGPSNIKITTREDMSVARGILSERDEDMISGIRVGHGYDVHKLVSDRKLILGGVEIPHDKGLLGHSDADVLLHAVMDSLLGAAGLGDIGRHFPDTDPSYLGISSMHLLTKVAEMIHNNGFRVINIDATVVLQNPKIAQYIDKMVSNIAFALGINEKCVNVKATSEEHLGFTGREEGASAYCISALSYSG